MLVLGLWAYGVTAKALGWIYGSMGLASGAWKRAVVQWCASFIGLSRPQVLNFKPEVIKYGMFTWFGSDFACYDSLRLGSCRWEARLFLRAWGQQCCLCFCFPDQEADVKS